MSSSEYNQLLKFLYFEGYADSYEEAEYILEEMSDEEFEDLIEAKDIPQEVALKLANMLKGAPPISARGGIARGLRQYAIERNKKRLAKLQQNEEIEELDERKLAHSFPLKPSERLAVERIRARLDGEEQERQTRSARRVEPEPTVVSKRKPTIKRTDLSSIVKEDFDAIVEFLFVEGYADTIENAELMAENISEEWVDEILEAYVDLNTGEMRRRANRSLFVKNDWERANKIDTARETHNPEKVQAKAEANRRRGEERRKAVGGFSESSHIQPPQEKLKTDRNMFNIPTDEREAAKQRTLAKAAEIRARKGIK